MLFFIAIIFLSCRTTTGIDDSKTPSWLLSKIDSLKAQPVSNPLAEISSWNYKNERVFYIPPYCCDNFGELYNAEGKLICYPDGGITGKGDGRCPDFFDLRKDKQVIWKDNRTNK